MTGSPRPGTVSETKAILAKGDNDLALSRLPKPVVLPLTLAACMPVTGTQSEFLTPASDGIYTPGWQILDNGDLSGFLKSNGNGVSFAIGTIPGEGLIAVSGIIPGSKVGATPTTGGANFDATYRVLEVADVAIDDDGTVNGTSNGETGNINLVADFDNATLVGSSGDLAINGVILPSSLDGSVEWRGHQGLLDGRIDGSQAFGAFHGANDVIVFSGGFVASAP